MMNYSYTIPAQGICPPGWHIPTASEWDTLISKLGYQSKAGRIMKSSTGWNLNGNGIDSCSLGMMPSGYGKVNDYFYDLSANGFYWSATSTSYEGEWMILSYNDSGIQWGFGFKNEIGAAVRCVKD